MFFSRKRNSHNDKGQKNFCGGCGCSCTCDMGCNGDVRKCTSKKALEKNCSHCCQCYMGMLAKRFRMDSEKNHSRTNESQQ